MGEIEAYYISLLIRQLIFAPTLYHRVTTLHRLAAYAARFSKQIREILPEIAELSIRASIYSQRLQSLITETRAGNVVDITETETDEYEQLLNTVAGLEAKVISLLDKSLRPLGVLGGRNE